MEEKEIKIKIPNGYIIDEENSTFECIKFKPIKKELPKTWEEFCKIHPRRKGYWLSSISNIIEGTDSFFRKVYNDENDFPNYKYAKAIPALCQLIQLRDCYNDGWIPDWTRIDNKYTIYVTKDILIENVNINVSRILAFKTRELRNEFFNNFRDLLEVAKPLL